MPQTLPETGSELPALALFTDFDGTLVEIAESPEAVHVPDDLAGQIERLTRDLDNAFAVITGREIADIDRFLSPLHLPVAGAHGSQRRRADGTMEQVDEELIHGAEEITRAIEPLAIAHPELLIEPKPGAVALHYRKAPNLADACLRALEEVLADHPQYSLVEGKMVYEARPIGFDKGGALRAFMKEEPFIGRIPIFIGDDRTDEDAFRAAQELGGVGIKLGPGETSARLRIADVASVYALMRGLGTMAHHEEPVLTDATAH
jgi:trehalose 6-phosphate phosphatase